MSLCHQASVNLLQAILTQNKVRFLSFSSFVSANCWQSMAIQNILTLQKLDPIWETRNGGSGLRAYIMLISCSHLLTSPLVHTYLFSCLLDVIKITKTKIYKCFGSGGVQLFLPVNLKIKLKGNVTCLPVWYRFFDITIQSTITCGHDFVEPWPANVHSTVYFVEHVCSARLLYWCHCIACYA